MAKTKNDGVTTSTSNDGATTVDVNAFFITAAASQEEAFAWYDAQANAIAANVSLDNNGKANVTAAVSQIFTSEIAKLGINQAQAENLINLTMSEMPVAVGQAAMNIAFAQAEKAAADNTTDDKKSLSVSIEGDIGDVITIGGQCTLGEHYSHTTGSTTVKHQRNPAARIQQQQAQLQQHVQNMQKA